MLIKVTAEEAYQVAKDWHVAKGWEKYAIIKLFQKEWNRHEGRAIDLQESLIYFTHFKSLKEVQEEYPDDWYIKISEGHTFGAHNGVGKKGTNEDGVHLEYLIQD